MSYPYTMVYYADGVKLAEVKILEVAQRFRDRAHGASENCVSLPWAEYVARIVAQEFVDLLGTYIQYGWIGCVPKWEERP